MMLIDLQSSLPGRGAVWLEKKEMLWHGVVAFPELWSVEPRVSVGMEFALFKPVGSSLTCNCTEMSALLLRLVWAGWSDSKWLLLTDGFSYTLQMDLTCYTDQRVLWKEGLGNDKGAIILKEESVRFLEHRKGFLGKTLLHKWSESWVCLSKSTSRMWESFIIWENK